jgi:transcription elongation GreA/GreB family factor
MLPDTLFCLWHRKDFGNTLARVYADRRCGTSQIIHLCITLCLYHRLAEQARDPIKTLKINNSAIPEIKLKLYELCRQFIHKRLDAIQQAITDAQSASNEETKSSAGDKYETGRAMMHLEIEKNTAQLAEARAEKRILDQIDPRKQPVKAGSGSLVITDHGNFFLAISVGRLVVEDKPYFAISVKSPIGIKLLGLKADESFSFNNKTYMVKQVC